MFERNLGLGGRFWVHDLQFLRPELGRRTMHRVEVRAHLPHTQQILELDRQANRLE